MEQFAHRRHNFMHLQRVDVVKPKLTSVDVVTLKLAAKNKNPSNFAPTTLLGNKPSASITILEMRFAVNILHIP